MFKIPRKNKDSFLKFVGYFTAHMVWQTEDGNNVVPLVAFQNKNEPKFERYEAEDYAKAKQNADIKYNQLVKEGIDCIIIYDGFLNINNEKLQSIIVEGLSDKISLKLAIPYKSKNEQDGAKIYKPKIIEASGLDLQKDFSKFYEGVYSHSEAWSYWQRNIDETM